MKTLQERIEEQAMKHLEADLKEATELFSNFLSDQHELFRTGISVHVLDDQDKKLYPYLSQIFNCEPVKSQIIKFNLERYIDFETEKIYKP